MSSKVGSIFVFWFLPPPPHPLWAFAICKFVTGIYPRNYDLALATSTHQQICTNITRYLHGPVLIPWANVHQVW